MGRNKGGTINLPRDATPYLDNSLRIEAHYRPLGRFRGILEEVIVKRILRSGIRNEHQRVRKPKFHRFVVQGECGEPQSRIAPSVAHTRLRQNGENLARALPPVKIFYRQRENWQMIERTICDILPRWSGCNS